MKKNAKPSTNQATVKPLPAKYQQVVDLLQRNGGATLEEMSVLSKWLPHSTRAFMTGLKKKGYVVESEKAEGIRRYRIVRAEAT